MKSEKKLKHLSDLIKSWQTSVLKSRTEHESLVEQSKMVIRKLAPSGSSYHEELETEFKPSIVSVLDEEMFYKGILKRLKTEIELSQFDEEPDNFEPKGKFNYVPLGINEIYNETVFAFNHGLIYLCAGGLRVIIEAICNDKKIEGGTVPDTGKFAKTLKGQIFGLAESKIITMHNANILTHHQYLGNKALHELKKPSKEELKIALEIIEFTLEAIYELEHKGKELQTKTQNRINKT